MISSPIHVLPAGLTGWRNKNGVSLTAVAAATKITPRYLEAIERGEFTKLPPGVYGLSYIRQYARAIQYDEDELIQYYRSVVPVKDPLPEEPPQPPTWLARLWDRIDFLGIAASRDIPHPRA